MLRAVVSMVNDPRLASSPAMLGQKRKDGDPRWIAALSS
jgi:hypothetical protein